jgi:putative resolvase
VIEHLLTGHGVTLTCIGEPAQDQSAESELVRDMLAIVTSFAGRLYGQRSAKAKRVRDGVARETRDRDGMSWETGHDGGVVVAVGGDRRAGQ